MFAILHKSYTWLTLPLCLRVLVSAFPTQKNTQAFTHRWSRNSPAAALCSILSLFHANTCSSYLHLCSTLLSWEPPRPPQRHLFFHSPRKHRFNVSDTSHNVRVFFLHASTPIFSRSSPFTNLQVAVVTRHGKRVWAFLSPHLKIDYGVASDMWIKTTEKRSTFHVHI